MGHLPSPAEESSKSGSKDTSKRGCSDMWVKFYPLTIQLLQLPSLRRPNKKSGSDRHGRRLMHQSHDLAPVVIAGQLTWLMLDAVVFNFLFGDAVKHGSTKLINIYMPHMLIHIYIYIYVYYASSLLLEPRKPELGW